MVVNANGLHDIVMTYIPTKKISNNSQVKNVIPPTIFKGSIPTLIKPTAVT